MQVRLGAKVMGPEGALGTIEGMVPTRDHDRFEDFIVRHGKLMAEERQVPFTYITEVDQEGAVYLHGALPSVEESKPFTAAGYQAPQVDWSAPPADNDRSPLKGEFEMDATLARGAVGYTSGKAGGYPGGEQIVPQDQQLPVIRQGTPILDISGEKVGEVGELVVNADDGSVAQLTVRSGFIFKRARDLSPSAIRELTGEGIVLTMARGELDSADEAA